MEICQTIDKIGIWYILFNIQFPVGIEYLQMYENILFEIFQSAKLSNITILEFVPESLIFPVFFLPILISSSDSLVDSCSLLSPLFAKNIKCI